MAIKVKIEKRTKARISARMYNVWMVGLVCGNIPCTLASISLLIFFMSVLFSRANIIPLKPKRRHILQHFEKL